MTTDVEFHAPPDLPAVLDLLRHYGQTAEVVAGGMSLLPELNRGIRHPAALLSLAKVAGLADIERHHGRLTIGAMTTHAVLARDPVISASYPMLAQAARSVGDIQVRHRGTIGGTISWASPGADYLTVLCALDADVILQNADAERAVPLSELLAGARSTILATDELITEVRLAPPAMDARSAYHRFCRMHGTSPLVGAAAVLAGGSGWVTIGGATPRPIRVGVPAEQEGRVRNDGREEALTEAVQVACENGIGTAAAPAAYRRALAAVLARRAVHAADTDIRHAEELT